MANFGEESMIANESQHQGLLTTREAKAIPGIGLI